MADKSSGKSKLVFKDVNKSFGNKAVLKNINLEIESGKFYCLLGPVGAGKTTLLKIIAGLIGIDKGQIEFKDQSFSDKSVWERNVSMVYQNFILYPHFNVFENVASPLRAKKLGKNEVQEKVESITGMLKISHLLSKKPRELSGGEMQRVAIARALIKDSDIYLFDEILVNLDYKIREEMRPELKKIALGQDRLVIFSTTDSIDVLSMGDRVIVIDKGEILQSGEMDDVYENPKNVQVGKDFGYPEMNVLEVHMTRYNTSIRIHIDQQLVILHDGQRFLNGSEGKCVFGIRPEDVRILDDAQLEKPSDDDIIRLRSTVVDSEVIGSDTVITTYIGDRHFTILYPGIKVIDPEEVCHVSFRREDILIFDYQDGTLIKRGL